ncbi:hypothetical protein HPB50_014303 [Hyalomma asiaticum]|uniref:Uncharacterized protein n=1 Tax=Hyalomma asiaticum TaxID=266040 RepID=A0ACB7T2J3_HYAAI|nr:hypothetical protein HPB50_014303 [Hyalomma asiaticum]
MAACDDISFQLKTCPAFIVAAMYGSPGQESLAGRGADRGWERIGDAAPEATDAAVVRRPLYRYRLTGFGCHTEHRIVEFLEELYPTRICCWCGVVAGEMHILSCLHVICPACQQKAFGNSTSGFAVCLIDRETLSLYMTAVLANNIGCKRVRCPSMGCDYTGCLKDLNGHLEQFCAFHLTTCTKCGTSVVHKDMQSHFLTCEGAPGVFLDVPHVQFLLEGLDNARRELDSAVLCSASAIPLENAVAALTKVLDMLANQHDMEVGDVNQAVHPAEKR